MNIKSFILKKIKDKGEIKTADVVKATGFSRAYINRFLQELREEDKIVLVGKANKARYVLANKQSFRKVKRETLTFRRVLTNKSISEDFILSEIKRKTGIFLGLSKNVSRIIEYAFTEMLNNAIEHSKSKTIEVFMEKKEEIIHFDVFDKGIGIFNNIMKKKNLKNELEAIQDLMKGKQTTAPREHTGEGIFFTSKIADKLVIKSSKKKLIFNNILEDVFIKDIKNTKGTKVTFTIKQDSKRNIDSIFKKYSEGLFDFGKTKVIVKLYKMDTEYISRSQARRIMSGLEKFKSILLDFNNVDTVGQAFADEIFRVWKSRHPNINVQYENANKNIEFMIRRAL
jgi:anti-sigma regulatory factor (Ser/Thr protein kinase)